MNGNLALKGGLVAVVVVAVLLILRIGGVNVAFDVSGAATAAVAAGALWLILGQKSIGDLIGRVQKLRVAGVEASFGPAPPPDAKITRPAAPGGKELPPRPGVTGDLQVFALGREFLYNSADLYALEPQKEGLLADLSDGVMRIRNLIWRLPGGVSDSVCLSMQVRILEDYGESTNWVGVMLGANNPYLGAGWLLYLRSNGQVQLYSPEREVVASTSSMIPRGKAARIEIVAQPERIVVWIIEDSQAEPVLNHKLDPRLWRGDAWFYAYKVHVEISELVRWDRQSPSI